MSSFGPIIGLGDDSLSDGIFIADEGVTKGFVSVLNFVGAGVVASASGTTGIITIAASGPTTGVATLNFGSGSGASDNPNTSIAVTGQTLIAAGSLIDAWIRLEATTQHTVDEILYENIQCYIGDIVPGTGFTIYGVVPEGSTYGDFNVNWSWS